MRIQTVAAGIAITLIASSCSKTPEDKLIGEWKGTDSRGETASFVFNPDRSVRVVMGNLVLDGPTLGGKVEWRVVRTPVVSKMPWKRSPRGWANQPPGSRIALDLVITPQSGQQRVLPMTIRFITDQKLQLRMSPGMQSRPIGFSADGAENQVVLVKQ